MKKVAFFIAGLNSGGIENYLLRFLQYSKTNIKPYVICKNDTHGDLYEEYKKIPNIELVKLKIGYYGLKPLFRLYQYLKSNQIESVCDFTGNFGALPIFIGYIAGINKRIVFYRGSTNHFKESFLKLKYNYLMNWIVNRFATRILSNSSAAFYFFFRDLHIDNPKFNLIYNGIDSNKFNDNPGDKKLRDNLGIKDSDFVVGHTGRFHSSKNHDTIIEVAVTLCEKYNDIYFVLCGKGTEEVKEKAIKRYPSLDNRIIVLGYRRDIDQVLKMFDLYFFPSRTEGQPNGLIEALMSGIPCITSNIPPILETLPIELHKFSKNPEDQKGFESEIERLYLDRKRLGMLNFSNWATKHYDSRTLFTQFLNEL